MSYAGSNLTAVLDALTKALADTTPRGRAPVACKLGVEADAENTTADRIVFLPRTRSHAAPEIQPRDGRAVAQKNIACDAYVVGHDFEAADALADRLVVAMYTAFGEYGAQVLGQGPGQVIDGGAASAASRFAIVVRVTFCVPVYVERFRVGRGGAPAGSGQVVNSQGGSPEEIHP